MGWTNADGLPIRGETETTGSQTNPVYQGVALQNATGPRFVGAAPNTLNVAKLGPEAGMRFTISITGFDASTPPSSGSATLNWNGQDFVVHYGDDALALQGTLLALDNVESAEAVGSLTVDPTSGIPLSLFVRIVPTVGNRPADMAVVSSSLDAGTVAVASGFGYSGTTDTLTIHDPHFVAHGGDYIVYGQLAGGPLVPLRRICCTGFVTTRLYEEAAADKFGNKIGRQLWVYDHGAETYAVAASEDLDGNAIYFVGGERDSDVTVTQGELRSEWTISRGKTVSGGTFRLAADVTTDSIPSTYYRTAQLAVDCTAADVQSALTALPNTGALTITCTGGPLNVRPISVSASDTINLQIQTQEVTGPATIRKLDRNGKLLLSAETKMPVKDMCVMGGNLYVLTDSSGVLTEPKGDTETGTPVYARVGPAVGEISGGTLKLVWRGQGILQVANYLDASTDIDWDCTAADVQTALTALIPDPGVTVACTGGPLPDSPIFFGVTGYTLGDPHFFGVLQGNVTGPVSLYKFDADLNLLATAHTGANTNQLITTDGTYLYVGHSGEQKSMWYGFAESTATGDITFRQFDDTLTPTSIGIATGIWCEAAAVQPGGSGNILAHGAGKDRMYKLTGGGSGCTLSVDGTALPSLPANATAAQVTTALGGYNAFGASGGPLPTPIYITQTLLNWFPLDASPTYNDLTVSGATLTQLVTETDFGPLRLYDSTGAYITTEAVQFGVPTLTGWTNIFPPGWHGIGLGMSGRWLAHGSSGNSLSHLKAMQIMADLSEPYWTVNSWLIGGDGQINASGFDSAGKLRLSGDPPSGSTGSTLGFNNFLPSPFVTWTKTHGTGTESDQPGYWNFWLDGSIYDQAIDSNDRVLITGTRVSRKLFP
jgi:hypothetical protein